MCKDISNIVKSKYDEYKNFMCAFDLPNIKIEYKNIGKVAAKVLAEEAYNEDYILWINVDYEKFTEDYLDMLLFHEFTHIYDIQKISREYPFNVWNDIVKAYSEPHATMVELMRVAQFNKIYDNKVNGR